MNFSFIFPAQLGKARAFLVNEALSVAAKQQGHSVVAADQADFIVLFDDQIPATAAGKKGAQLEPRKAFANPEAAIKQAVENAKIFANANRFIIAFIKWREKYRGGNGLPNGRGSHLYVSRSD